MQVLFAGNPPAKTKWVTAKGNSGELSEQFVHWCDIFCSQVHFVAVNWNEELWLPVMLPTMTSNIEVSVWDYDR